MCWAGGVVAATPTGMCGRLRMGKIGLWSQGRRLGREDMGIRCNLIREVCIYPWDRQAGIRPSMILGHRRTAVIGSGEPWAVGAGRFSHQMEVFPPAMVLFGIGQPVVLNLGASSPELHTYSARYGGGAYTYAMVSDSDVFDFQNRVLKTNSNLAEGRYTLTVMVTDAEGSMDQNVVNIDVQNNFAVVDVPPLYAEAEVTMAVSLHTFAAVQGTAPITFTIFSGNEGGHFTLNAESSELFVQNASVAIYTLGVRAEDSRSPTRRRLEVFVVVDVDYALSLAAPNLIIPTGITAAFHTLSVTGGGGTQTFYLTGAEYFSINAANGVLLVSNAPVGNYNLAVRVSDATGSTESMLIELQVVPQMALVAVPPLDTLARLSVTVTVHTFSVNEGVGNIRYTILDGNDAGYFTLNADSGELLFPPNPTVLAGTHTLQVQVLDSLPVPQRETAMVTVRIAKNGIFVLGGDAGSVRNDVWMAADDGVIWQPISTNNVWPARSAHQVVLLNERIYVLGGYNGSGAIDDVWSSGDGGVTWTFDGHADWSPRSRHQAVSHQGTIYVMGGAINNTGYTKEVWSSTDGITWQQKTDPPWAERDFYQAVSHNGRIYVLGGRSSGGNRKDTWSSADGENWVYEGDVGWTARSRHQAVSHNGRIYVMGGNDGSQEQDVWSSVDGKNWRLETATAAWPSRVAFQAVSRNGLLYVMGGSDSGGFTDDVWSSADGQSWTEVTANANWTARNLFQAVVFPSNLDLPGTSETITLTLQAGLEVYTFSAQYGGGEYKYSLPLDPEGFNIDGDGVLAVNDEDVPAGIYTVTVQVDDAEKTRAESVINIELRSFALADAPSLAAATALPATVKLHTFSAIHGVGVHTYAIVSGNTAGYFSLGENSGVLAVVNASVGIYTLGVEVEDGNGSRAEAVATVAIREVLALADVPLLGAIVASTMSIYTFIPANLQGAATYTLVAGAGYFSVNPSSGVLSVANAAAGFYTVTVEISDGSSQAQVAGVVQVVLPVALADITLTTPKAGTGAILTVHTFAASDGFGEKFYAVVGGNQEGYFVAGSRGPLLLVGNDAMLAGHYTLSVEVTDSLVPPQRATAAVVVNILITPRSVFLLMGGRANNPSRVNDVWQSVDGETWTPLPNADWSARYAHKAVWHNNRAYVMGGYDGSFKRDVWSTADGSSWVYEGTANWGARWSFGAVSHNGRIYVMGGDAGSTRFNDVWSSADGRSWVSEGNADWQGRSLFGAVSRNGRIYVIGGQNTFGNTLNDMWSSADGQNWSFEGNPDWGGRYRFGAASHNGRMYVTGGNGGLNDVWSSEDGTSSVREKENNNIGWSNRIFHEVLSVDGLLYLMGGLGGGRLNDVWSSADGKSWTKVVDAAWPGRQEFAVVADNQRIELVIIADSVVGLNPNHSGDFYQVSTRFGFGEYTYSVTPSTLGFSIDQDGNLSADGSHDAGQYTITVHVEDAERLQASAQIILNSNPLTLADASPQHIFTRVHNTVVLHTFAASGGGIPYTYNLVDGNSAGYFTLDEESGVLIFPTNENAAAGDYVLVVEVVDILSERATARVTVELDGGRKMFVLGGFDGTDYLGDVWSSSNPLSDNFTEETASAEWPPYAYAQTVPHNGLLYKIGGQKSSNFVDYDNDVWSSRGGKNWTRVGSIGSNRIDYQAASLNGRLYVAGGGSSTTFKSDVRSSGDGRSWRQETGNASWPGRYGHQMVAFNGRLYVLGGQTDASTFVNDVWSSANGGHWEFEGNADWSARGNHQAVVRNGRIYVMGGSDGSVLNDVWSSEDGKNWTEENADAKWAARQDFAAVSFNNFIWLVGGSNQGGTSLNDMWASMDGKSWIKNPANARWSARVGFDAVLFPPRLALHGIRDPIQLAESGPTSVPVTVIHTFTAEYGFGALTYSLEPGHNANFSIDNNGALRTNKNLAVGSYTLTAKVVDSESTEAKAEIRIIKNTFKVADAPPLRGYSKLAAQQGFHTFRPSGGTAPYTYRIFTQGPFEIGENNGWLSLPAGSNAKAGSYPLLVQVRDSRGLIEYPQATVNLAKNRMIVLSGYNQKNDAWESEDGVSWRQRSGFGQRRLFPAVSHRGRVWAMGGYRQFSTGTQTNVSHSATGAGGWGSYNAPWAKRDSHDAASNGDTMYLMGGDGNKSDVWSTVNGSTWTLLSNGALPGRSDHQMVWHHGRLYVLGGDASGRKNDVWSSADGISWRSEGNADWVARERHQAFSHKGWIYVLGGLNASNGRLSDVWRSLDGRSWEQVKATGNQAWTERHLHGAFALDGRLYLMGGSASNHVGFPNNSRLSDVWSSADDGVTWTLLGNAAWGGRMGFGALAYPPNLVLHGTTSDVITVSVGLTGAAELHKIQTITARDGYTAEPYTYSLKPNITGIDIDRDGVLSVDDSVEGRFYRITVQVVDGEGTQAEMITRVDVHALRLVDVPPLTATARLSVAVALYLLNGIYGDGAYTYNLVGGNDLGYFALGSQSGALSLPSDSEMRAGIYNLLVEVSDGAPKQATAVVQVHLLAPPHHMIVMGGLYTSGIPSSGPTDVWAGGKNDWTRLTAAAGWTQRQSFASAVHNGRLYIMGGIASFFSNNEVWSSADGETWQKDASPGTAKRYGSKAVSFNGKMYLLGGSNQGGNEHNEVWTWQDGTWSQQSNVAWPGRRDHQAVVHNGRIYVMGGRGSDNNNRRDVWSSADGVTWREETGAASWLARINFKAVSHNGLLYVMGGEHGATRYNDVWSSLDGKTWEPVTAAAGWSIRREFQALSYKGLLYVMGGYNNGFSDRRNDVWSSADGKIWEQMDNADWTARWSPQAQVFPAPLVLWGANERFILSVGVARANFVTVRAQQGFGDYTYSLVPKAGFSLDSDGALSENGSNLRGAYTVTVRVTDADGTQAETVIKLDIHGLFLQTPPPISIYGGPDFPPKAFHTFVATEGKPPYTYVLKYLGTGRDRVTPRFSLGITSGVLAPDGELEAGNYNFGVEATDADGKRAQVNVWVTAEPALSLTDAPPLPVFSDEVVVGQTLHTFAAGGGIKPITYNIVSGNAGGYFAVDASGVLSVVKQPAVGVYPLSVRVSDSGGSSVDARAEVDILLPLLSAPPPLVALARVQSELHNFTGGGIGAKGYIIFSGNKDYFEMGIGSGILSVKENANMLAGDYALRLQAIDEAGTTKYLDITVRLVNSGFFVMGGDDGANRNDVWFSVDGITWYRKTNANWTGRKDHQVTPYNGKLYAMGGQGAGFNRDVWSSTGGTNWTSHGDADWTARSQFQAVEFKGGLYVMGGQSNAGNTPIKNVWSSTDGNTWQKTTPAWSARRAFQSVDYNERLYMMGGATGSAQNTRADMWSSANGTDWVQDQQPGWFQRYLHQAVSHNGKMYVVGGHQGGLKIDALHDDVWATGDGTNWTKLIDDANWTARFGHQVISHGGRLYLMGGQDRLGNKLRDVWSSVDGYSWNKVSDAPWSARVGHQAVVFPPNIYVPSISGIVLSEGVANANIHTFQAQRGAPAYTYSLEPAVSGFSIGESSGVLATDGTAGPGSYLINVLVKDKFGRQTKIENRIDVRSFTLPGVDTQILGEGVRYNNIVTFQAQYGVEPYTYSLKQGVAGFFLYPNGVLAIANSNTPEAGIYNLTVVARDQRGRTAETVARLDVRRVVLVGPPSYQGFEVTQGVGNPSLFDFDAQYGKPPYFFYLSGPQVGVFINSETGVFGSDGGAEVGVRSYLVKVQDERGRRAETEIRVRTLAP